MTISLYNQAIAHLVANMFKCSIAPEIGKYLSTISTLLPIEEVESLLMKIVNLPKLCETDTPMSFAERVVADYPLELAKLKQKYLCEKKYMWTSFLVDLILIQLNIFAEKIGVNAIVLLKKEPETILREFHPPKEWLHEAEIVHMTATVKSPIGGQLAAKRRVSITWKEIEHLEAEHRAKKQRNINTLHRSRSFSIDGFGNAESLSHEASASWVNT